MMKLILSFALCLCLFGTETVAQNKYVLSGAVTDATGHPVSMATVAIEHTSLGAFTDDKGHYTLELSAGKHIVAVSSVGYKTERKELNIRKNTKQDFMLEENTVVLKAVEVYGKTQSQQVREGAYAANALDVRPLTNTIHSLNTIVNRTMGVKVREEGGAGSDFELSVNGLSGNSVRYFIDGVPMSAKGRGISLANLPVNIIDRVEIYKGVVPSHLGGDALGGAINVITRKERKNYLDVSYGIGSFHTHKADMFGQYVMPKSGIVIRPVAGINYSKNDYLMKGVELWDEAERRFRPFDRKRFHDDYFSVLTQLEAGVTHRRWADEFFLSGSFSSVHKQLQTGSIQSIVYGKAERESEAWNISARYMKNDFLLPGLKANLSLSHTWDHALTTDTAFRKYNWDGAYIESSRNEITGRDRTRRHNKRPLTTVRTGFDYRIDARHGLNLNYLMNHTGNERYDEIDTDFDPSNDIFTKHILGLSYNQRLVNDRWQNSFFVKNYTNYLNVTQQDLPWITGSREKQGASTKNYTGYGLATRYGFGEGLSLKASYEHSMRLPLARELLGNGTTVYANLQLKPESSDNYNLGLFGTLNPAPGHQLFYEVNGFFRNVKDYIRAVISEAEGLSQYGNVASVAIKGIESEVRYTYDDWLQVIANGSYEDARSMTRYYPDGKEMITYKNRVPNRPWLFGNVEVNVKKRDFLLKKSILRAGYNFEYVHWFFLTWEGYGSLASKSRIPSQYQHNVSLSLSFDNDKYNVSVTCNNLFDRLAYDNFKLQKPGRSFFCKFRIFIN